MILQHYLQKTPSWGAYAMIDQNENRDFVLRKAGFLDIPFVFFLIQEGSLSGSFTEFYLTSKGYLSVLKSIFVDLLYSRYLVSQGGNVKLLIFTVNNEDVGFIKLSVLRANNSIQIIDLCAIKPEYRNKKYGTQMIRMVVDKAPQDGVIFALCTKYSRAMQRVLKNLKFHRDKKTNKLCLESYRFTKSSGV